MAQSGAAAALWDFGVRPVGVFGPHKLKDGGRDPEVGEVDIAAVESIGNVWGASPTCRTTPTSRTGASWA
ncbi:hypothetical protein ACWEPC_21060 [Nonomuraea sp. NPDC004297]